MYVKIQANSIIEVASEDLSPTEALALGFKEHIIATTEYNEATHYLEFSHYLETDIQYIQVSSLKPLEELGKTKEELLNNYILQQDEIILDMEMRILELESRLS